MNYSTHSFRFAALACLVIVPAYGMSQLSGVQSTIGYGLLQRGYDSGTGYFGTNFLDDQQPVPPAGTLSSPILTTTLPQGSLKGAAEASGLQTSSTSFASLTGQLKAATMAHWGSGDSMYLSFADAYGNMEFNLASAGFLTMNLSNASAWGPSVSNNDGFFRVYVDGSQVDTWYGNGNYTQWLSSGFHIVAFDAQSDAAASRANGEIRTTSALADYSISVQTTPEPASMVAIGLGLSGLLARRRRAK